MTRRILYSEKARVLEAEQFRLGALPLPFRDHHVCQLGRDGWFIETHAGRARILDGDWIIRGAEGEFSVCKADIFEKLYAPVTRLACLDCGALYSDFPLDLTLPDDQWLLIHPEGSNGILCASCIVKRAAKLPGAIAVRARIDGVGAPEHEDAHASERGETLGEARSWRSAAQRLGEELASVGPDQYYDMTPVQWIKWALPQVQRLIAERDEARRKGWANRYLEAEARAAAAQAEIARLRAALELQRSIADRWESVAQCGNEGAPCRTCDNQKRLIEEDESRLAALTPPAGTE